MAQPPGYVTVSDVRRYWSEAQSAFDLYFSIMNPDPPAYFYALTLEELRGERDAAKAEADRQACLAALAAMEAAFRLDYRRRSKGKLRDPISRDFRQIYKARGERARLAEDIVETWKGHRPDMKARLEDVKGALNYRHWLAHGRYDDPKLGRNYDFVWLDPLLTSVFADLSLPH